jgi:hypothetical protein
VDPEEIDLTHIQFPPWTEADYEDHSPLRDWNSSEEPLTSVYTLPAQGLEALERDRYGFHVVNADTSSGDDLGEAFGVANTLIVDGHSFVPDHFVHQLDVLSKGGKEPVRVVFRELDRLKHGDVFELEKFFNRDLGYPIKSIYFVDDGSEVDTALRHKILMQCDEIVDSATLLDSVAFGWGAKNPYDGKAVGGETADYTDRTDFSTSEAAGLSLAQDELLLEMVYLDKEQKFIRLGLDPAAQGREVGNSGEMLFKSLRKRGVTPDEMMGAGAAAKKPEDKYYRYARTPTPPPPPTPFLTKEEWMGLKRLDKIWCHSHLPNQGMVVLRYQISSNDNGDVKAYNLQNFTTHGIAFFPNLWHLWERAPGAKTHSS